MNILIAPDSFKESLSAKQVGECIQAGFSQAFPNANYHILPLADGGEGTIDVLLETLNGQLQYADVSDPCNRPIKATWALLDNGKTALIEMAAASGLHLMATKERNPNTATSFGTGEIIRQALDIGVEKILMGLGGSATNDAGAGIFQALGGRLFNAQGVELAKGGLALQQLAHIDFSNIDPRCKQVEMIIACDVSNPLCGANGASHIFGKQKGATPEDIIELDKALANFAKIAQKEGQQAGFGAAGGSPLGLSLVFDIQIKSGIDMVLDVLNADQALEKCDLVITGEGQMDNQTLQGKVPFGIAKRAKARQIPVIGIAGSLGTDIDDLYSVIDAAFDTVRAPANLEQVLAEASTNLTRNARNIAMLLKLGEKINLKEC